MSCSLHSRPRRLLATAPGSKPSHAPSRLCLPCAPTAPPWSSSSARSSATQCAQALAHYKLIPVIHANLLKPLFDRYFRTVKKFPTLGTGRACSPRSEFDPLPPSESHRDHSQRWKTPDADGHVTTIGYHLSIYIRFAKFLSCLALSSYICWQRVRDSNPCTGLERAVS